MGRGEGGKEEVDGREGQGEWEGGERVNVHIIANSQLFSGRDGAV